jgi:hypothetical protein
MTPHPNERMLADLQNHFARRVRVQINDIANTCELAELDNRDTVSIVISALMYEIIRAAAVLKMDEDAFLNICQNAYRSMIKHARKEIRNG